MVLKMNISRSPIHNLVFILLASVLIISVAAGCSTAKNTAATRWWHAFNARYNTYYNGTLAYIDGSLEKETGNQDNFTDIIPLYTVGNKNSRELGKSNFERAILKAEKAIDQHSIKARPQWNSNKRKTDRDREWLSRREYNPFLWKAWMLMGRSQFHKGAFDEAISTFAYMSMLYRTQPVIYSKAQAWLAKSYVENGQMYDAEDVIRNNRRDSIPWQARKDWDNTLADYYLLTQDYKTAIPFLRATIKREMRKKQKAREWFLMGQICSQVGLNKEAYHAFSKVIGLNPPYDLEFNARIARTEVMAGTKSDRMIAKLRRMARSDKNKDYLDQVYYAIGNIYLAKKDTIHAIANYEKGHAKATRTGVEHGALLLKLGNLYWDIERYADAQRIYNAALGMVDKDNKEYEQLSDRSKVLDELVPYTEAIHLQDSLQSLAKMDEAHRNAAIDRTIEALKKREKEAKKAQEEQEAQQSQQRGNNDMEQGTDNTNNRPTPTTSSTSNAKEWYFYSQTAVSKGKQQFQRLWGKRENVDNWQRINKSVVKMQENNGLADMSDEQRDSVFNAQAHADSVKAHLTPESDPHKREYYLAQIPFTAEQLKASNDTISDALYNSGVIFKDKLDNLNLSEKALTRLIRQYPGYEHKDDAFYHLFLLYSRKGQSALAETFVDSLKADYPKSQWTILLSDPNYVVNARYGVHMEDSLYAATYDAFKTDKYQIVDTNVKLSETRFPQGANRNKFIFIGALGKLNEGDSENCLKDLNTLVEKYPENEVSKIAGMIINGVKSGKRLRGAHFDIGDIWAKRSEALSDSAQLKAKPLSAERNTQFDFMLVYQPDSVNENKLLYQVAKYNFTSYLVRDFDIAIDNDDYLHRMRISGFRSYDEALEYSHSLLSQPQILKLMGKARPFIISVENLPLIGVAYSYDDYKKFYDIHFAPIKPSTLQLLNNPEDIVTEPQEQIEDQTEEETQPQNGVSIPIEETNPTQQGGVTIPMEESKPTQPLKKEDANAAPVKNTQPKKNNTVTPNKTVPTQQKQVTEPTAKKPAPAQKKPVPAPKKQIFDIESEDYELDGF
jgi:tetratricopeptide (TPR) repeat protein